MMHPDDQPKCFASHLGVWLMQSDVLNRAVLAIKAGVNPEWSNAQPLALGGESLGDSGAYILSNGIGVLELRGAMMKGESKFGGISTVKARQAVRAMAMNKDVEHILLVLETGGGSVSGTQELGDEIRSANETKGVTIYAEDMIASAGYWIGAQAGKLYANKMAEIGSIGVYAVVHDTSGAYEREGIKVHLISSGDQKGIGTDGIPITEDALSSLQERVASLHEFFIDAVVSGRGLERAKVEEIADGRTMMASKAEELGLIDGIRTIDEVVSEISQNIENKKARSKMSTLNARMKNLK